MQVGEELLVDEGEEIVANLGGVVVDLAVLALGRGPRLPAVGSVEDVGVFFAVECGFGGLIAFEGVEVFQEEQPRGLLGVVEFAGATGVLPEDVVDIFEGLFEHGGFVSLRCEPGGGFGNALLNPLFGKFRVALECEALRFKVF